MGCDPLFLLGVGAQKCGTSWLYEQLAAQPAILMSPIKELHYWDRRFHPDFFAPRNTPAILNRLLRQHGAGIAADPEFERIAMDCGEDYYLAFFRSRLKAHHRVLGEISPSYSILSADEFRYIRGFLPWRSKAVFLMRDPVERIWSQCRMRASRAAGRGRRLEARALFAAAGRKFTKRTAYEATVRNLLAAFPAEDVFFGFYETLFSPAEVKRLVHFLGLDRLDFDLADNPNKGAETERPGEAEWDRVRQALGATYAFVLAEFGDRVPANWRGNAGLATQSP